MEEAQGRKLQAVLAGKKVLVTGGNGFIGRHLVARLLDLGALVTSLDRAGERLAPEVTSIPCDLADFAATRAALAECRPQFVVHLASKPDALETYQHARDSISTNTLGTLNLLEAMHENGEASLLYGDSTKSYGDTDAPYAADLPQQPLSSYAISKVAGWELCRLYQRLHGMRVASIRPTLVYGPGQPRNLIAFVIEAVLDGRPEIVLQGGDQTREPLYIDDAVDAYLLAMTNDSLDDAVVNVGGGEERSVFDIAAMIIRIMGADTRVHCDQRQVRATDTRRSRCDPAEASARLSWQVGYPLQQGLALTIDWHRAQRG